FKTNRSAMNTRNANNLPKFNSASPNPTKCSEFKPRGPYPMKKKCIGKSLTSALNCADPKHSVTDCPHITAKEAKVNSLTLPPPHYPQPSENFQPQAPTRQRLE